MSDKGVDPLVVFMPSGRRGRFARGTSVLDAARSLGVYVESVCGGRGLCGRCQVTPSYGVFAKLGINSGSDHLTAPGDIERRYAERRRLAPERRLSCAALIEGDLVIDVPLDTQIQRPTVRKRAEARDIVRNPSVKLYPVNVVPPDMANPRGDLERLLEVIELDWQVTPRVDHTILPSLQKLLREGEFSVTAVIHHGRDISELIAVWPGVRDRAYGLACDIGSTTIAMHLIDLISGRLLSSAGSANPQIRFGEDLMSRVSYVMLNPGGEHQLTRAVRRAVSALIDQLTSDIGITRQEILDAVFVGNPIMHHLFLGLDPSELGQAPFALATSGPVDIPARVLDLNIHPGGRVYVLPCIAGHVGADAAGATLAEGPQYGESISLMVDVGTNAEIVLGSAKRLVAASSPTGPAFEGAEISCGQRAAPGAIERVRIDPVTLEPRIKVIGLDAWSDEESFAEEIDSVGVTGICGSGIIEAIGELFLAGVISQDGILGPNLCPPTDRLTAEGRTYSFILWRGTFDIIVSQKDVRAIQLAKAALYAGIKLLMDKLDIDEIDEIRLAGAFGSYLDPKYAMLLGIIPDCDLGKVRAVGNAAGTGARMALLNQDHRREVEALVERIDKVETALEPKFQEHFVAAMALPHKWDPFVKLQQTQPLPQRETPERAGGGRRRGRARR